MLTIQKQNSPQPLRLVLCSVPSLLPFPLKRGRSRWVFTFFAFAPKGALCERQRERQRARGIKKRVRSKEGINTLIPYFELFLHLDTHAHLKNLLDTHFHSAYNPRNLLYVVPMQFVRLYNHPMAPFLIHLLDMHERTGCSRCNSHKFLLNVTYLLSIVFLLYILFVSCSVPSSLILPLFVCPSTPCERQRGRRTSERAREVKREAKKRAYKKWKNDQGWVYSIIIEYLFVKTKTCITTIHYFPHSWNYKGVYLHFFIISNLKEKGKVVLGTNESQVSHFHKNSIRT